MDEYKDILEALKPRREIKASVGLRNKVQKAIDRNNRKNHARKWIFSGISLGMIAAILLLVFIPSGISAGEVLKEAINALTYSERIAMTVEIRTLPMENFRYIDINQAFVPHHIDIARLDTIIRWRVDKGERIAIGTGQDAYTWVPSLALGWHLDKVDNDNLLGYLSNFLTPQKLLKNELDNSLKNHKSEYEISQKGKDIILTVNTAPEGDFANPYLLNTSITESKSIRRYLFDSDSKRLKSATVSILKDNNEIEVLRLSSIDYNPIEKDICQLDTSIRFVEIQDQPAGLNGLNAEEATSIILNAFADWNLKILDKVMNHEVSESMYRRRFEGSRLLSIGRSFTSGNQNTIFIPYTLKLRNGTLQHHNLALQKTKAEGWVVVGGL